MNVPEILRTIGKQISAVATGKIAFSEPITVGNRIVIPVAWVRYDFGAGGGAPVYRRLTEEAGGGGGGGQVSVVPAGMIEITPKGTRFIPIPDGKKIFALVASSFAGAGNNNRAGQHSQDEPSDAANAFSEKQAAARKASSKKAAAKRTIAVARKAPAKKSASVKTVAKKAATAARKTPTKPR